MIFNVKEEFLTMAEEKKGGVTVYISPDIVEALKERHQQNVKASIAAGLDPLAMVEPSTGWQVRAYLRAALGMNQVHGGE
ncbi:hypothetical protein P4G36_20320 [Escherichia coli]|nr:MULTISPECIES: hypothetical protein [Enterobacteriaceae]WNT53570.1 hypothetical protein PWR57_15780 [Escherichia coli O121]EDU63626.1 conserved hypothetical protein [Escherichia coli 53638]EDU64009.1 conserved hypothetical protein [Escherichia coli 53638]MCV3030533.1 hypothetical protein [Escherichia coli]MDS1454728.1 hypothetical protein [Escherichia coli]